MTLKAVQQDILDALEVLLKVDGVRQVFTDPPDSIGEPPCLVIFDEPGMLIQRPGNGRREVLWDLTFQVFMQRTDLFRGSKLAREIKADLIDALDMDCTIGQRVQASQWIEQPNVARLDWGEVPYLGISGVYRLVLLQSFTFS